MPTLTHERVLSPDAALEQFQPMDSVLVLEASPALADGGPISGNSGDDSGDDSSSDLDGAAEVALDGAERTFGLEHGPLERWQRSVSARRTEGGFTVTTTIDYRLAVPFWRGMFTPLINRQLKASGFAGTDDAKLPFWSPPSRLDARAARTLSGACMLAAVAGYFGALLTQTLTFVADDLGGGVQTQSWVLAAARVGALATLGGMALADRHGRRMLLSVVLLAGTVTAASAALAPTWPGSPPR